AGGGTGRAFHAGVLAALQDTVGLDARNAEIIVGTSAGSIDGSFLRAGVSPRDLWTRIAERPSSSASDALFQRLPVWRDPDEEGTTMRWRPASSLRLRGAARRPWRVQPRTMGTLVAAAMRQGRRPTRLIRETIDALQLPAWPEALWVCTVRLDDGKRVVFGRDAGVEGTLGEAVAASCAIPGYFAPVTINGVRYVDGGAHSPSNADLLAGLGLDLVVISSPMTATPRAFRFSGDAAFRAGCRILLRREAAALRRRGAHTIIFEPSAEDLAVMGSLSDSMAAHHRAIVANHVYESVCRRLRQEPMARLLQSKLA
ncbi:MAG: patatin-like phospholipase family protein, partial [Candidatus Dormibacteria bacterium]